MHGIQLSLRGKKRGSLAVGNKVKGAVFDVGEPCLVEAHRLLACMVQSFSRDGIAFGKPQDSLDPS